jgi:hypothetical protein
MVVRLDRTMVVMAQSYGSRGYSVAVQVAELRTLVLVVTAATAGSDVAVAEEEAVPQVALEVLAGMVS